MRRFAPLLAAALIASPCLAQTVDQPAPSAQHWRDWARADLAAMRETLRDNHPMMVVDKDAAAMRAWLDAGYAEAVRDLPKVKDSRGYAYLLNRYGTGFRDGHIGFSANSELVKTGTLAWPGFATGWRAAGGYYVAFVDPAAAADAPPLGARLVACDGQPADDLATERLDLYDGDLARPTGRYRTATRLLWDRGNPFTTRPDACIFETGGVRKTWRLAYRPAEKPAIDQAATVAGAFVKSPLDVVSWGDNRWWISIPTMEDRLDWKAFFEKIDTNLSAIRNAETVVIDLRGNGGGNSAYGDTLAARLWGADAVAAYRPRLGPVINRATPMNRDFLAKVFAEAAKDPLQASPEHARIIAAYDAAIAAGRPTFTLPADEGRATAKPATTPMQAQVILLTDYAWNSACLDLMDLFQALPKVRQAGTSTSADTIFMELTLTPAPSGRATIVFGHKVWIERPRGSNVAFDPAPDWTYPGVVSDDAAWRAWLEGKLG